MPRALFPRSGAKYDGSPFGGEMSDFCRWLQKAGYSKDSIRGHLRRLFRVLTRTHHLEPDNGRSSAELHALFEGFGTRVHALHGFRSTERAYRRFLEDQGRLREDARPIDAVGSLLQRYRRYLQQVRGLSEATIGQHVQTVSEFVRRALRPRQSIRALTSEHVHEYLTHKSKRISRHTMQHVVARLRAFLRYGSARGLTRAGLDVIDTPRTYRDELPPRALPWPLVKKLLLSIDLSSRAGWRDYTILHLMAYYGLRASEVVALRVDSIDWHAKTCRIEQRKTRSDIVLPLSGRTLRLLRRYLYRGRSQSPLPQLFLRVRRPFGSLRHTAVCDLFYKRAAQSGLPLKGYSSYSLRHSFAMRLLQRGVGVKAIGDLLGHRSLEATCVYLRLDVFTLRSVALPLPTFRAP
jgi:integrase/recombinase XerD